MGDLAFVKKGFRMTTFQMLALLGALITVSTNATANEIALQVHVKKTKLGGESAFPLVGQLAFRRNSAPFQGGFCQDVSDSNGMLTCRLACPSNDKSFILHLIPPTSKQTKLVDGLWAPAPEIIEVKNCVVTSKIPVVLVYKRGVDLAAELQRKSPEVFAAAAAIDKEKVSFKPFAAAAPRLAVLAKDKANQEAIDELSELASLHSRTPGNMPPSPNAASYEYGARSVVLRARANVALGDDAAKIVTISPTPSDYNRSVSTVSKAIDAKAVLSPEQIELQQLIMKQKAAR